METVESLFTLRVTRLKKQSSSHCLDSGIPLPSSSDNEEKSAPLLAAHSFLVLLILFRRFSADS